jgi:hypothetical protein
MKTTSRLALAAALACFLAQVAFAESVPGDDDPRVIQLNEDIAKALSRVKVSPAAPHAGNAGTAAIYEECRQRIFRDFHAKLPAEDPQSAYYRSLNAVERTCPH